MKQLVFLHTRENIARNLRNARLHANLINATNLDIRSYQNPYNNSRKIGKDFRKMPFTSSEEYARRFYKEMNRKIIRENPNSIFLLATDNSIDYGIWLRDWKGEVYTFDSGNKAPPSISKIADGRHYSLEAALDNIYQR